MDRRRIRIRFRKQGDLRLISHRDLLRTLERLLRRAELKLRMSEGFHPKPRISFPSALPLGVCGLNEVVEIELADEPRTAAELHSALSRESPPGFEITSLDEQPPGARKGRVRSVTFEMPLPEPQRSEVARRAAQWPPASDCRGAAEPPLGPEQVELVELVDVCHDRLRLRLRPNGQGGIQPRAVLAALGLDDWEQQGLVLSRTDVELET